MAIVDILQHPDPRLKRHGEPVKDFGPATQAIIDTMFETHYAQANCAALACTQLDIKNPLHITVIDFSDDKNSPLCLVNAKITAREGEQYEQEGCMSVGDSSGRIFEKVKRDFKISVEAQDRHGNPLHFDAEGFMAKCIQHELDHLNGVLFIDRLSPLKRERALNKLKKLHRQQKSN